MTESADPAALPPLPALVHRRDWRAAVCWKASLDTSEPDRRVKGKVLHVLDGRADERALGASAVKGLWCSLARSCPAQREEMSLLSLATSTAADMPESRMCLIIRFTAVVQ